MNEKMSERKEEKEEVRFIRRTGYIATRAREELQETRKALKSMERDMLFRINEGIGFHEKLDEGQKKKREEGYSDEEIEKLKKEFKDEGKLSEKEIEYLDKLDDAIEKTRGYEDDYEDIMADTVQKEEIWRLWLKDIRGVGTTIAAKLVRFWGYCRIYEHVSSLWKHSGLHPAGAEGKTKGVQLNWDPKRKTCAIYDIGRTTIVRNTSPVYYGIKEDEKKKQLWRMNNSRCEHCGEPTVEHFSPKKSNVHKCEDGTVVTLDDFTIEGLDYSNYEEEKKPTPPWSRGHAENRAVRKAVKIFLQHYWVITRQLKGLSTEPTYPQHILKHDGYIEPPNVPEVLKPFDPIREEGWRYK